MPHLLLVLLLPRLPLLVLIISKFDNYAELNQSCAKSTSLPHRNGLSMYSLIHFFLKVFANPVACGTPS